MASFIDKKRQERIERLRPFLHDICAEKLPRADRGFVLQLIQDLKDEGNVLFKEDQVDRASDHYKMALYISTILEDRFYHDVDAEFMTTLYTNGSLCYLKLNKYTDALDNAEAALKIQPNNTKAIYRKTQALEGLKRYKEALEEAKNGLKLNPATFKPLVGKLEEVLEASRSGGSTKSATASATVTSQSSDLNNEWLVETNALRTEKQRQAVLKKQKMPKSKKKKARAHQPVVVASSESDSDSDSSRSVEDEPETDTFNHFAPKKQKGKPPGKVKTNVVAVKASEPDPNTDVLAQRTGFTQVGAVQKKKSQPNGMGLDTFGMVSDQKQPVKATKSKPQSASASKQPPVNINWPLEDAFVFRLACKSCFVKTGEGYKGYRYVPNYSHMCEKNVLIIRRKDNDSLNWIKIRPFPELHNNKFNEFKYPVVDVQMCQQFVNALPCKIGEVRCTFPHNKNEMNLWYMELDEDFCYADFMQALRENNIDTSEELAARRLPEKAAAQHIPGLNYKTGARQRLSSPAPLEEPANRRAPQQPTPAPAPASKKSVPPPAAIPSLMTAAVAMHADPSHSFSAPSARPVKTGLLGSGSLLGAVPPPVQPAAAQQSSTVFSDTALDNFEYKILCTKCFIPEEYPGRYRYMPCTHECEENVLAVKPKNVPGNLNYWMRVRERTNHRDFPGKYVMCHSIASIDRQLCHFGESFCSFAHNEAEQHIWGLEKLGKFSITDFILQNRKKASMRSFTVTELLKKHGGYFTFICRACMYGRPPSIREAAPNNTCSGMMKHKWDQCSILAHVDRTMGTYTPVEPRRFVNKSAFFRICKYVSFCPDLATGTCMSAHSIVERDVWMLERDTDISRLQIVQISQGRLPPQPYSELPPQQRQAPGGSTAAAVAARPPQPLMAQIVTCPSPPPQQQDGSGSRVKVPYTVREYCGLCWSNGTRSLEDGTTNRCVKSHSNFKIKRVFLIVGIYRELRNLPGVIPRNLNFTVCRFIQQKKKCQYMGQGPCQFAHSEEERVLWIWMARSKVTKLEDVVKQCLEDTKPVKINHGDSVVSSSTVRVPTAQQQSQLRTPSDLQNNGLYCRYCSVAANSDRQWEEHCASEKHLFNVNSDKDHQWNYRQPPWGQGSNLSLCYKHVNGSRCPFSHVVHDMFNLCLYAHSQEELDEWRERYEWRQMKRALARQHNMFSYMDQLLDRYNAADSRVTEISETLTGVQVECSQPLVEYRQDKNATLVWSFTLQTQMKLEKVALLHHSARLHFHLHLGDGIKHQIISGDQCQLLTNPYGGQQSYQVSVHFTGGMFGSYTQWVVFDLGKKPVLVRKLNVELGQKSDHDKVKDLRQKLDFDRWTGENRQVIPYQYIYDDFTLSMLQRYKEPSSQAAVTQDSVRELNQHNYVHKMHRLLDLEEITRHKLISSFNMVSMAEVMQEIVTEQQNTYQCRHGELFLRLPLTDNLTEDTGAGKLILSSVRNLLLTRNDFPDKHRVYEALIEAKGKDYVCVSVSPVCVRELKLKAGMSVEVEVQFQINRMHFINMHYAVDLLENTDIVFPDITKINPAINEQHTLKVSSRTLNPDQLKAVKHIVAERTGYTPPFIMYGPFGTGKTETLAQAAMVLLREKHDARILICAQSNSAADLYVTKHLDPFLRRSPSSTNALLLRIVSKDRRVTSIPEGSRKYCYYSQDGSSFEIPPADFIRQVRIVVTTVEMSLRLSSMKLKGVFTHIFIDEAAQALECETVMALILATEKTCVVMTGDHLQISPKVYSAEARRQNFGISMLERLFEYYSNYSHQLQQMSVSNPLNIFLSINYRTKMEILRFISAVFYGGPEKLVAGGSIPSVVELTPLQFYAVLGREEQEGDSTSYVNMAECSELVERVISLLSDWPREWGKVAPEEISVITPYYDQVKRIRTLFKSHRRADLRLVNVEPVQNIQGKEFRALFISTVRTRHLLRSKHVARALAEAESMGGVTDFAFLSDRKLLNTALTRTQSVVAVVGDPMALCAIGDCIQIWRTYLKHCNNMRSIRPPHMTYENIKSQVVEMQLSPMGQRLKEVTEMCKNPISPSSSPPPRQSVPADRYAMDEGGDTVATTEREVYVDDFEPSSGAGDGAAVLTCNTTVPSAAVINTAYTAPPPSVYRAPPPLLGANTVNSRYTVPPPPSVSAHIMGSMYRAPPPLLGANTVNPGYTVPPPSVPANTASSIYGAPPPMPGVNPGYTAPPPVHPAFSRPPLLPMVSSAPGLVAPAPLKLAPLKPLGRLKLSKPVVVEEFKAADFPIKADEILLQLAMEGVGEVVPLPLKVECIQVVLDQGQALLTYDPQLANEDKRRKLLQAAAAGKEFAIDSEIHVDVDEDTGTVTKYYNYTEQALQAALHNNPDGYKRCVISVKDRWVAETIDPSDSVPEIEINGLLNRGHAMDQDEVVVEILPAVTVGQGAQGRVVGILQRFVDHRYRTFVCSVEESDTSLLTPITPGSPSIYNVILHKHLEQVKMGRVCVYNLGADKTLSFSHYEKVEGDSKLFVVRYLKWLPGFHSPVGVVVGVIPVGSNLTSALKIVDIEHNVPMEFSGQVLEEVRSSHTGSTLPAEAYSTRSDQRQTWSFTIDDPQATDLQVAFSIEQVSDTSYRVYVHITDVASFVKSGSTTDMEALQRGASLLPVGRGAVPMLPGRLSSELCSLVTGQDRCTLSVCMTVAGSGEDWHVVQTSVHPTVINSKQRYTYGDVDSILDDIVGAENDYLKSCVLVLFQIAQMQHKLRLGNAHLDPQQDPVEVRAPRGHQMVREILIMTNHQVAGMLLKAFPQCTPLLQQAAPSRDRMEQWRAQHAADAINSVALTKPFLDSNKVCTCRMVCMCVFSYMRSHEVKPRDHFHIANQVWGEIVGAASQEQTTAVQRAVASSLSHPQSLVARQRLLNILPPQRLVCSGDLDPLNQGHYMENLPFLTQATDPLRSYVSLVVQRLMWAMVHNQPCPYSQPDLSQLMDVCNTAQHRAGSFSLADQRVRLAAALQSRPLALCPVVESVDRNCLRLCFPNLPCIPRQECRVSLAVFWPSTVPPVAFHDTEEVKVTMEGRIYDTKGAKSGVVCAPGAELCGDRLVSYLPPFQWQQLLAALREDNEQKQLTTVATVQAHVQEPSLDQHYAVDVSCEDGSGSLQPFTEFSLSLHPCMMLGAQLTAGLTPQGLLTPQLQLLSLTPSLDLCLEHGRNPATCFAKPGACAKLLKTYRDEAHYQQHLMPVLAVEAAETAVCSQESALVHNVIISWNDESLGSYTGDDYGVVVGRFSLGLVFCQERHLFSGNQGQDDLEQFGLERSIPAPLDLVCVRYKGVEMGDDKKLEEKERALMEMGSPGSWVGHCQVVQVKQDKQGGTVVVSLQLLSSSVKIPSQLLQPSAASQLPCTVELIPRTPLYRQMEFAVACLTSASRLARDVAVGRKPVNNIDLTDVGLLMTELSGQLNSDQTEAVHTALKQPFTVITGPPGCGKTWTAFQLALLFVHQNRLLPLPPTIIRSQVLVCASSDAALDRFAVHLENMAENCPRVVRVYDERVERQLHPVPRGTVPPSKLKAGGGSSVSGLFQQVKGLHELIRSPASSYRDNLLEYESVINMYPNSLTDDQVEAYQLLVMEAELKELRQAEVILTTCSSAASARMARGTSVKQIIVDSCESCMEVEALLPAILMRSAQQLVVLGDRQQLRPAVMSSAACAMGLGCSLVERYSDAADITLSSQYRMSRGITEVPSECFYGGGLNPSELGPGTAAQPLVFCHLVGQEESTLATTEVGLLPSFTNINEAQTVVDLVEDLVNKGVAAYRLVVLTQYVAHLQLIKEHLAAKHLSDIAVYTVHQAQGSEYDFVVFSTCRSVSRSKVQTSPTSAWLEASLGVTADAHQMNVAFTRAREVLIITGNKYLLQCQPVWRKVLDVCRQRKSLIDAHTYE